MHMIRLIIEMESRLIPQNVMKPRTPISMLTMENATQREQTGLGIKMSDTNIMMPAAMATHWMVVGRTTKNYSIEKMLVSYGFNDAHYFTWSK